MGSMSFIHWVVVLVMLATYLIPVAQILRRTGFSSWLAVLALIPGVNVVLLWVFAFAPWPQEKA
jgi:hypothetical protein